MKLESEPRNRCAECGAEQPHMIRMERGGPYCETCLIRAANFVYQEMKYAPRPERPLEECLICGGNHASLPCPSMIAT